MNDNNQDIVGVRFVEAGAISYCRSGDVDLGVGDYVVVRTDRGERLGWVVISPDQVLANEHQGPMRVIARLASQADIEAWQANRERAKEDTKRAQELAARADPRIRVASIEYDIAGKYCDLSFASSERVGYDWLEQQAADLFHADVQVRQVGDRDRAKALGGLGVCGRALCCATWQIEFPSISIKMAKEQDLSPNPAKISGVCGRLLCCLSYEVDAYRELRGDLPQAGKRISTPVGRARVLGVNVFKQVVRLRMEQTGEVIEIPADELRQQYGTTVRPLDLDAEVEEPVRRQDRQRRDSALAVLEPIARRRPGPLSERGGQNSEAPGSEGEGSESTDGGATAASSGEEPRKRKRRRGRRGGRRRRGGGGGSGSSDS